MSEVLASPVLGSPVLGSPALLLAMVGIVGAGLALTAWSGWRGLRRLHFGCLAFVVPAFCFTIVVAETVGRGYRFEATPFRVHMGFAYAATLALLAALASGVLRLVRPDRKKLHRVAVLGFFVLLVGAVGTGLWMMATGTPKQAGIHVSPVEASWSGK